MVYRLKYGNTNTFLVSGSEGYMLVDTDYAGTISAFYKAIKNLNVKISDISYVLATHYHPDHIGLISELMEYGVKLVLIDTQIQHVHFADEIFSRDKHLEYMPIDESNALCTTCGESRAFLKSIGINGEIIPTTSHSDDSVSLVLDSGEIIVGDLEPVEYLYAYDNNDKLRDDWNRVMSYAPKIIYYAHANEKNI